MLKAWGPLSRKNLADVAFDLHIGDFLDLAGSGDTTGASSKMLSKM